jgi:hypothetical protein
MDVTPPAARLNVGSTGSLESLGGGGGGGGDGMSMGGGGADVSFFGVSSRGTRIAYIVDTSGSMSEGTKIRTAMAELARSIDALPDYASFYVVLFNSGAGTAPWQKGWLRARPQEKNRMIRWLDEVSPGGGTQPLPAFNLVFALDVRPDVIFFMTDGQIPAETPMRVAELNGRGGRVVINTIAFGDPTGQDLLKQIAEQSGGAYRFVAAGGGP